VIKFIIESVYEHKELLTVVGILEDKLLLEGDYSGGTNNSIGRDWLPIKGTSRIYNHAFKERVRKDAIAIETLAIPCIGSQDNTFNCMMDNFLRPFFFLIIFIIFVAQSFKFTTNVDRANSTKPLLANVFY
jgi:hypothetical protein